MFSIEGPALFFKLRLHFGGRVLVGFVAPILARHVIFFLRAWGFWARTYIKDPAVRRRSTLTSETVLDVESALAAVINIIALCADKIAGNPWVFIHRLGSDMCEALFARCGGWMGKSMRPRVRLQGCD